MRTFAAPFPDATSVEFERLFQILKETARPVGHYWHTGAGLPDAVRALGRTFQPTAVLAPLDVELGELRNAMRRIHAPRADFSRSTTIEPPRGPAAVSPVPLNPYPWSVMTSAAGPPDFEILRAAMVQAGLASLS